jgi:imidazolonepropionase
VKTLFINIKELVQIRPMSQKKVAGKEMAVLPTLKNAFLVVEDGLIADFGTMENCPNIIVDEIIDAKGKMILPTWCDSHTHIVYVGDRSLEFVARINGSTYEEIADSGGGILNSALLLQQTTDQELYEQSETRLKDIMTMGTGAIEIKSGYGLTPEAELKMLRVIKRLKANYNLPIKSTFLAAHAVPKEYKNNKKEFIDKILNETLPIIEKEDLAEYIDVFCEEGYFTVEETEDILQRAKKHGLIPKIHVNQFNAIGGVQIGVRNDALSVDHLEIIREKDIESLQNTPTIGVALPACSFFLGIPYTPARAMIDRGLPLALASDYNPGSSPTGNMNFVVATACIKMKMTPEEAINAATINGAYAMGLENEVGSITVGKRANLILTKAIHSYATIPYEFASNHIEQVYISGIKI